MAGRLSTPSVTVPLRATKVPVPNINAHRRAAMDAFTEHETLLGDPKGYTRQLGPAGYAQALALAEQRAAQAEAPYKSAWVSLGGPVQDALE